jgi:tRNA threonylcarbamoyladenosine dehydratase
LNEITAEEVDAARRFGGVARLYGESGLERFQAAHVVVIGLGGVGSWAAEALARSAVGTITLIDMDHVSESNINRQLVALTSTVGASKIEVMKARLLDINPALVVHLVDEWVTDENVNAVVPTNATVVIDAIDQPRVKAALIAWCAKNLPTKIPIVVCGAAGGRLNAGQFAATDIALVKGDALIASVRGRLRRDYGYERALGKKFGVTAVHSLEIPQSNSQTDGSLNCGGYGSSVVVTASMGMMAAQIALNYLMT